MWETGLPSLKSIIVGKLLMLYLAGDLLVLVDIHLHEFDPPVIFFGQFVNNR